MKAKLPLVSLALRAVAALATLRNVALGGVELNPLAQVMGLYPFLAFACILSYTVPYAALTAARLHGDLRAPMLALAWLAVVHGAADAVWDLFLWDSATHWDWQVYWGAVFALGYLSTVALALRK